MKLLIILLSLLPAALVNASPMSEITKDNPVCFERAYSERHMGSHPLQTVKSMQMKFHIDATTSPGSTYLNIKAQIKKNRRYKPYQTDMNCRMSATTLSCSIDCDGGTAKVEWETSGKDGEITFVNKGFIMYGGCGEETDPNDWIWLDPKKGGDDIFKLYKMPTNVCKRIKTK